MAKKLTVQRALQIVYDLSANLQHVCAQLDRVDTALGHIVDDSHQRRKACRQAVAYIDELEAMQREGGS